MDCKEFLSRFSEYHDDADGLEDRPRFEAHLASCARCRRYRDVVFQGVELLRSFPPPALRDDFHDRLQHRLYQSELEDERRRRHGPSGPATLALAAAAVLVAVAVWAPIVQEAGQPTVALPEITAEAPQPPATDRSAPDLTRPGTARSPGFMNPPDFWAQSHILLYEHSPLYHRAREAHLIRTGLQ
jgi:anti-sigma factor RsiW